MIAAGAAIVLVGAVASRESRPLETAGLVVVLMVFSAAVFVWLLGLPIPLGRRPEPMETLGNLAFGLGVALTWQNLIYCFVGCFLGTLVGVLPGIGPVATVAMLLPFTFNLGPAPALIMLAGIYYGAQYGGSTTAILVNIPGKSSSVVTTLDGHQMARKGRAGPALGIAAIGSFIAGCIATLVVAYFAPPLAELALKFGPAEYFSLMVFGLIAAVVLARGSVIKAIAMVCFGILLGLVGTDVNSGTIRFAFGQPELTDASASSRWRWHSSASPTWW